MTESRTKPPSASAARDRGRSSSPGDALAGPTPRRRPGRARRPVARNRRRPWSPRPDWWRGRTAPRRCRRRGPRWFSGCCVRRGEVARELVPPVIDGAERAALLHVGQADRTVRRDARLQSSGRAVTGWGAGSWYASRLTWANGMRDDRIHNPKQSLGVLPRSHAESFVVQRGGLLPDPAAPGPQDKPGPSVRPTARATPALQAPGRPA